MTAKILQWENSVGIRLPQPMLKSASLTVGDYCEVRLLDSGTAPVKGCSAHGRPAGITAHQNPENEVVKPVWLPGDPGA